MRLRILFDPTQTEGGNGGGTGGNPPSDPNKAYEALLAKHNNDASRLAESLHRENGELRRSNDAIKAKLPADGSVVLTAAQAKQWTAYVAMGEPKDVAKLVEDGRAATAELAGIKTAEALKAIGKEAGYNPTVFARLAAQDGLAPERFETIKIKGKDGKEHPVVHLKGAAETDPKKPIEEFVSTAWGDFELALKPSPSTQPKPPLGTPPTSQSRPPRPAGESTDREPPQVRDQLANSGIYAF